MRARSLAAAVVLSLALVACGDSATDPGVSARAAIRAGLTVTGVSVRVFGAERFLRSTGSPVEISRTLAPGVLANVLPPFTLHVRNGAPGVARASSAIVKIDGVVVVSPSDLSRNVDELERLVELRAGSEITVEIRGAPGSGIELVIDGVPKPETPPSLVAPTHDARIVQNDPTTGCPVSAVYGYGSRIGFHWTAATGPKPIVGYELTAGYPTATIPILSSVFVQGTSYVYTSCGFVSDAYLDGWQWHVRARYADGSLGALSATGSFGFTAMPRPAQVLNFTLSPPSYPVGKTRVSLSGAVDPLASASVVLSAVVNTAQSTGAIAMPYPLIEFFRDNGGALQKIGESTTPTLLQTPTDRFWTYTFTWDPEAPVPVGAVVVVAVRTEYGGSSSRSTAQVVTVVP